MLPGTRVLIADDDPQLLDTLAEVMEHSGASVVRAHTGAELIDRLADSRPFDLIVTDIGMPWLTGLSSIRAARSAGLHVPVIVITGLRDKAIPAQVRALGRNAILLRKPFQLQELESAVERLLPTSEIGPR